MLLIRETDGSSEGDGQFVKRCGHDLVVAYISFGCIFFGTNAGCLGPCLVADDMQFYAAGNPVREQQEQQSLSSLLRR
jgi:hypothetical protein